jgi:hypothetical protein
MNVFRFPIIFRRPPVSTGAELAPRSLPPDTNGVVTTLAKGVNDLLNYYIQVIDTKASIMIAASVTSASFLLSMFPDKFLSMLVYVSAASFLGGSLIFATLVVLPRLPAKTGKGCVFWGDIASSVSAVEFRDRFASAAVAGLLDDDYSTLNFYTARILARKIRMLRFAILTFLAGVLLAVVHHLIHR